MTGKLRPFTVAVADELLADLRRRLDATLWPDEPDGAGWSFGANLGYMRRLVDYWRDGYNWRHWESVLNQFPQHLVAVGDLDIHVIVEPGSGARPMPLLITHGWPGSVFEFHKIIDKLAHPERFGGDTADAFTVICPSLPGYGFSAVPRRPLGPRAIAGLWRRLMAEGLGYSSFGAQGGDWGSIVSSWLGVDHGEVVTALHLNMVPLRPALDEAVPLTTDERRWIGRVKGRMAREGGYFAQQSTKPQSLAFGMTDSPIGLAAWIVEKWHGWPGAPADQDPPFSMDELLTNIMIYWISRRFAAASWLYWGAVAADDMRLKPGERVRVPTTFLLPERDLIPPPPLGWLDRGYNVVRQQTLAGGGHFTAMDSPDRLVDDIRGAMRPYRPPA